MLQSLRQFRRRLAGTFGFLVAGTWLALALAPCTASADMAADAMAMEEHCPHCDHASSPCAEAIPDCDLPVSLAPGDAEHAKPLKHLALPAALAFPDATKPRTPPMLPRQAVDPPHPPFTQIFCRYQE